MPSFHSKWQEVLYIGWKEWKIIRYCPLIRGVEKKEIYAVLTLKKRGQDGKKSTIKNKLNINAYLVFSDINIVEFFRVYKKAD